VAVVRGLAAHVLGADDHGPGARSLRRPLADDMFALGAREAVVAALAGESAEAFGAPAPAADLVAALARVGVTGAADGELVRLAGEAGPEARAVAHAHGWVADRDVPAVLQPHLP
jgi:coenzyme F420-0:L-glutamate ligase/coenzyme F420-1:gamma-L-glutamate ligase